MWFNVKQSSATLCERTIRYGAVNHHKWNISSSSLNICMSSDLGFIILVHLYSSTFRAVVATVVNIFLDIHPGGRAVAKLKNKKKSELQLLSFSTCINGVIFFTYSSVYINLLPNFHTFEIREKTVSRVQRRLKQNASSHNAILIFFTCHACFRCVSLLVFSYLSATIPPGNGSLIIFLLSPSTGWREDPSVWLDAMERSIDVISGVVPVLSVYMKDGDVSVFVAFCVCVVSSMRGSLFFSRKVLTWLVDLRCWTKNGFDWRGARSLLWISKSWT